MNPAPLYIVGAGGFGREVWNWLNSHPDHGVQWTIDGFLDDSPNALAGFDYPVTVVGSVGGHQPDPAALYVCGIGLPKVKEAVCRSLEERGARFLTLVHPTAIVGRNVLLGTGTVVCPGVIITADVKVGRFVTLNCRCGLGHDVTVGDFSTLSAFCDVTGRAVLGRGVMLGSHAAVIPDKSVGDYATVGAGAVVMTKVPAGATVYCPPARQL
jgi:sugar O-acyltransferase (sialic acid O-acetyltransferase NeuD family)